MEFLLKNLNIDPNVYKLTDEFRQPSEGELFYNFKTRSVHKCIFKEMSHPYPILVYVSDPISFRPLFDYKHHGFEFTGEFRMAEFGEFYLESFNSMWLTKWTCHENSSLQYPIFRPKIT